jgi:hypothetical protein
MSSKLRSRISLISSVAVVSLMLAGCSTQGGTRLGSVGVPGLAMVARAAVTDRVARVQGRTDRAVAPAAPGQVRVALAATQAQARAAPVVRVAARARAAPVVRVVVRAQAGPVAAPAQAARKRRRALAQYL